MAITNGLVYGKLTNSILFLGGQSDAILVALLNTEPIAISYAFKLVRPSSWFIWRPIENAVTLCVWKVHLFIYESNLFHLFRLSFIWFLTKRQKEESERSRQQQPKEGKNKYKKKLKKAKMKWGKRFAHSTCTCVVNHVLWNQNEHLLLCSIGCHHFIYYVGSNCKYDCFKIEFTSEYG